MHIKRLTLPLEDHTEYEIPEELMVELHENYFDVDQELRRMRMWLLVNPERRKTKRGIKRFIVSWLNRAKLLRPQGRPLSMVRVPEQRPRSEEEKAAARRHLEAIMGQIKHG